MKQTRNILWVMFWLFFSLIGVVFFLQQTNITHATQRTLSWGTTRDNSNFITGAFWAGDPSTWDIIKALYGSGNEGSAYTRNRSGWDGSQCSGEEMQVIYTGNLPSVLVNNTIYVLTSLQQNFDHGSIRTWITMATCSTIISKINSGTLFSGAIFTLLYSSGKSYIILDNISISTFHSNWIYFNSSSNSTINNTQNYNINIYNNKTSIIFNQSSHNTINNSHIYDWYNGISISWHSNNNTIENTYVYNIGMYPIIFYQSSNNTINNTQVYNNKYEGILFNQSSNNNTINNSSVYNNERDGILIFHTSNNNTINNSSVYNNERDGIRISYASNNNTINNTQIYNNSISLSSYWRGIFIEGSSRNIINNTQIYNNRGVGIKLEDNSSGNIIHNTQIYNNINSIYLDINSTNNKYYGNLSLFANNTNIWGTSANLISWSSSDALIQHLGRSTGELTTWTMSWDFITNPLNTSGNYLLLWADSWTNIMWMKGNYIDRITDRYSYGSGISTQIQPVLYSGTSIITGMHFDPNNYIWSDVKKVTGDLLWIPPYSQTTLTVTGISSDSLVAHYSLFWDITNFRNNLGIWTQTGIVLSWGDGEKRVVTQLFWSLYFATHFQKDTILDTTPPTVSTGYLTEGLTGENASTLYYKTGSAIQAYVSDTTFIDSESCMYTTGTVRYTASWSDTACRKSWLNLSGNLNIRFSVKDLAGNTTTWATGVYLHDITGPLQITGLIPSDETIFDTGTINFSRSGTSDTGIGLSGYYRQISSGTDFSTLLMSGYVSDTVTGFQLTELNDALYIWRVYGYDKFNNTGIWSDTGTFTIDTTPPSQVELILPSSWAILSTGNVSLVRSAAVDTWSGISGYYFEVMSWSSVIDSWSTTTTGTSVLWLLDGTYQRRVYAIDNVGTTWERSETRNFVVDTYQDPELEALRILLEHEFFSIWSYYTQNRSGYALDECEIEHLVIITPDADNYRPADHIDIQANTIYVVQSGNYMMSTGLIFPRCNLLLGSGNVTLYQTGNSDGSTSFSGDELLMIKDKWSKVIIKNISAVGENEESDGQSKANTYGFSLKDNNNHIYLIDFRVYNFGSWGIFLSWGTDTSNQDILIERSEIYNNTQWIVIENIRGVTINNIQIYNNTWTGISIISTWSNTSQNIAINNTQIYWNAVGTHISSGSKKILFNNLQIYNNHYAGINIARNGWWDIVVFIDMGIFNNQTGILFSTNFHNINVTCNKYIFGANDRDSNAIHSLHWWFQWCTHDIARQLDYRNKDMDCHRASNPIINTDPLYTGSCDMRWQQTSWTTTKDPTDTYNYGTGIFYQNETIKVTESSTFTGMFTGANLIFTACRHIGDPKTQSGDICTGDLVVNKTWPITANTWAAIAYHIDYSYSWTLPANNVYLFEIFDIDNISSQLHISTWDLTLQYADRLYRLTGDSCFEDFLNETGVYRSGFDRRVDWNTDGYRTGIYEYMLYSWSDFFAYTGPFTGAAEHLLSWFNNIVGETWTFSSLEAAGNFLGIDPTWHSHCGTWGKVLYTKALWSIHPGTSGTFILPANIGHELSILEPIKNTIHIWSLYQKNSITGSYDTSTNNNQSVAYTYIIPAGFVGWTGAILFEDGELQTGKTIVGTSSIDFQVYNLLPVETVLQSTPTLTWSMAEIKLPEYTVLSWWNGVGCTKTFVAPRFIAPPSHSTLSDHTIHTAISLGLDCPESLYFYTTWWLAQTWEIRVRHHTFVPGTGIKVFVSKNNGNTRTEMWIYIPDAEQRIQLHVNHLSQFAFGIPKTATPPPPPTIWGGGWGTIIIDDCTWKSSNTTHLPGANNDGPNGKGVDYSPSYYDGTCLATHGSAPEWLCTAYTKEINDAYNFAYTFGITNIEPCTKARLKDSITRAELAKMLVYFVTKILWWTENRVNDPACYNFADIGHLSQEMQTYITTSCTLGIMWLNPDWTVLHNFMPSAPVYRRHLATTISRILREKKYEALPWEPFYQRHIRALVQNNIIKLQNPELKETRGRVMIILQRIYKNFSNK